MSPELHPCRLTRGNARPAGSCNRLARCGQLRSATAPLLRWPHGRRLNHCPEKPGGKRAVSAAATLDQLAAATGCARPASIEVVDRSCARGQFAIRRTGCSGKVVDRGGSLRHESGTTTLPPHSRPRSTGWPLQPASIVRLARGGCDPQPLELPVDSSDNPTLNAVAGEDRPNRSLEKQGGKRAVSGCGRGR